jgi:PAS domain S-box-containing protein
MTILRSTPAAAVSTEAVDRGGGGVVRAGRSTVGHRLGLRRSGITGQPDGDRAAMARAGFWLFSAGATLALASLALPNNPRLDEPGMLVTIAAAYAASLIPLVGFTRLPLWAFHALSVAGTALVSFGVHFGGVRGDVYGLLYFWVVLYACYFFSWRTAALHMAAVALAYAAVLHAQGQQAVESVAWLLTVGTLTVAGTLTLILTGRLADAIRKLMASDAESRERGTRLAAVIQSAPVAIIERATDNRVRTWNAEAERIFGWCREDVLGRLSPVSFTPAGLPDAHPPRALAGRSLQEASVEHPQGGVRHVAFTSAGVMSADGTQSGTIDLAIDVTDRRNLEEQLRRAQKMEAVGRLGGAVAHDFNNILLAIRSYAWLLGDAMDGNRTPERESLTEIEKAVDRATVLTKQLLAFSQRQVEPPEVVDLNTLLQDITGMLRPLVGDAVKPIIRTAPEPALVLANVSQLEQVLVNLTVNATQAMPAGGTLTIDVQSRPADDHVTLRVRDTGVGLDPQQQRLIFEPFYTTRRAEGGTGLGLSTVYGIVTAAGGRIDVTSTPGRGTTFTLRLPRAAKPHDEAPLPAPAASLRGSETILLVEDDHAVSAPLQRSLQHYGYHVLAAADGQAALDLVGEDVSNLDIVVTDVVMPSMGGEDLVTQLRETKPTLRVLYVSGYVGQALGIMPNDEDQPRPAAPFPAVNQPHAAFLQKPFTVQQLVTAVRSLLPPPVTTH